LQIVGIAEAHWLGTGHFKTSNNNLIYFSGGDEQTFRGVAILITKQLQTTIMDFSADNNLIIRLKFKAKPQNMNVIQIYAPTASSTEEEIQEFYNKLEITIQDIPNKEITIMCGDFSAKIGNTEQDEYIRNVVGKYGIGRRNERGDRLIQFAVENDYTIMNTTFKHHIRRPYTWKSPGDSSRNQIDYFLAKTRWRTTFNTTRTYPGAVCGSDHNLLVAHLRIKLKKKISKCKNTYQKIEKMYDVQKQLHIFLL
jgi:exonuclease III